MPTKPRADRPPLIAYWRVWWRLTRLQFETNIANARGAALFFLFGKLFRLATAFLFVYIVIERAKVLAGYNLSQAILILALFNLVTTLIQLFLRAVYIFRQKVVEGTFDFYLLNPLSELFYSLFSYTDPLDLTLLLPYTGITLWAWVSAGYSITLGALLLLFLAIILMFIFAVSVHLFIISIGIRYLEVDNTIMLYRDLEKMAAFPIEIYGSILGNVFTYLLPFALMATLPARFIFGFTSPLILLYFIPLVLFFLYLALRYWQNSLKSYSSASS